MDFKVGDLIVMKYDLPAEYTVTVSQSLWVVKRDFENNKISIRSAKDDGGFTTRFPWVIEKKYALLVSNLTKLEKAIYGV